MHKWFVYKEFNLAAKAAADFIADRIEASIQKRNICHICLPGGNTPKSCFAYLVDKKLPWNKIHWYPGDERCFPKGHAERNDVMLENYLWSKIGSTNIYPIPAEKGAEEGAEVYRGIIDEFDSFDIAFLGIGEDGHTASLFPDNDALNDSRSVIPVYQSPKPPSERVSLSIATLKQALNRIILAGGHEKASVIAHIKKGKSLPVNCMGDINWYIDEAAISLSI